MTETGSKALLDTVARKIDAGLPLTTGERIWVLQRLGVDPMDLVRQDDSD